MITLWVRRTGSFTIRPAVSSYTAIKTQNDSTSRNQKPAIIFNCILKYKYSDGDY